ncbi:MAG: RagB/SusD family nutrient uptake outer membrane protein [Chitinophaga sp.]|uniref:RagB/SusD family nutrient uptake outer membrane protein n=1 Tax=Chitinophaga sp. TaxID=1869181 RepID=UPI001B0FE71D|nr:RagB/SusD family nutrient uptake outer membrane protein [Chitinophaga sp.]MBO9732956.1 RagB/SusD family nutrient uptake outer membrane protein [Chitinophaga sp.]
MKKNICKLLLILPLFSAFLSCHYLDKQPDSLLSEDLVWKTRKQAESYLYGIYGNIIFGENDGAWQLGTTEESYITIPGTAARKINDGNWSPSTTAWDIWGTCYTNIRSTFVFENNIDKVPSQELSDDLKRQYKAEVKFLRGYYYWNLLKRYGPFIKLDGTLGLNEDFNKYSRAPFDTCLNYVNQLMDDAAAVLPLTWSSSWYGKPTKGACLSIKAEAALLAASPLWNGNPDFAGFKNKDGRQLAPTDVQASKWATAAAAAKAVIDLGVYKLYTNEDDGEQFDPFKSYTGTFLTPWNNEIIFSCANWNTNYWDHDCTALPGGFQLFAATQNAVDAYYTKDGKWITDPTSNYQETGFANAPGEKSWGHATGDWNMYANREPRFYASICYNKRPVIAAPTADDRNRYSSDGNKNGQGRIEFYYRGASGRRVLGYAFPGYLIAKGVSPAGNSYAWSSPYRPFIITRYAGILLDYVEALNESNKDAADIVIYLNMIRARSGVPPIEQVYPAAIGNQAEMRKHILRERMIEMAFERGDNWWTRARRKDMNNDNFKKVYGMNFEADDNDQGFGYTGFYQRTLLQTRYFDKKMYLFPISQSEIVRDTLLVQNPGW